MEGKNQNQSEPPTKGVSSTDGNPIRDSKSMATDFSEMPDLSQEHNEIREFESLSDKEQAIRIMLSKAGEFASREKVEVRVVTSINEILQADNESNINYLARCKFNTCVSEHQAHVINGLVLLKNRRIISYGVAWQQGSGGWFISYVEVDRSHRRRSLFHEVELENRVFRVGVLHVLVREFCDRFDRPLRADAYRTASYFVFRSCGFKPVDEEKNSMILELR